VGLVLLSGCQASRPAARGVRPVQITNIDGQLELTVRDRRRRQESKVGAGKSRSKETWFEEAVRLDFDGYAYHPNFLEFALGGLFGWVQRDFEDEFDSRLRTSRDDGPIGEFEFRGDFLQKKPYPGTVFARRYRAVEPRPFQTSLEVTTTNYGVVWQWIDAKTPTSFQFTYTDVNLDPNSDFEEEGEQTNSLLRFETAYRFSEHNVLSLLYTRESVDEKPFNLSYDTDELTLGHRLDFGTGHRQHLDSELNYFDQRGTFEVERFRWRETLRLQHAETLRSWYLFELLDRTQGSLLGVAPLEERSYSLSGTVEHQLFESLLSRASVWGQEQEFGSGLEISRVGADLSWDYRKKNAVGTLLANYRLRLTREDRSGGDNVGEVLDEAHTFRDPEPIVLTNTLIDRDSIMMTAQDRFTIFRLGSDYTVLAVGDRLEIRRVPTGRIADGQTVLVDYTFRIGGDFRLETVGHFFTARQNFSFGLSPYYRWHKQDQNLMPPDAPGATPEDISSHLGGVEYQRGPLLLGAEYEDHDSTVSPFRAVRLNASYTRRFAGGASGTLRARWTDITRFPPNERETRFFTLEGRYRQSLTKTLLVETAALYRNERDSLSGRDEGVDVDFTLEWNVRQTEVRLTYEYGKFDDDFARNESSALYVQMRRRF